MVSISADAERDVVHARLMRPIGWTTLVLAARAPYVLFVVAGLSALPLLVSSSSHALIRDPALAVAAAVGSVVFGLCVFVVVELRPDLLRRSPQLFVVTTLVLAPVAITIALSAYGPDFGVIMLAYPQAVIFAFVLLRLPWALCCLGLTAVLSAVVFAVQDGWVAPFGHWTALVLGTAGIAVTAGALTARIIALAESEQAALDELGRLNATLQERVDAQVAELERTGELRRFLAPQVADAVLSGDEQHLLEPHRRKIAVLFCDLRGFTAFAAQTEPEDVMDVLGTYYRLVGERLRASDATIGGFAGDGIMAYWNDPVPCDDPAGTAVGVAAALRDELSGEITRWRGFGHDLGVGIGVALGHATLGVVGFEGRQDYTALGTVVNLAARLCGAAADGQVLIDPRAAAEIGTDVEREPVTGLNLKGLPAELLVYAVL